MYTGTAPSRGAVAVYLWIHFQRPLALVDHSIEFGEYSILTSVDGSFGDRKKKKKKQPVHRPGKDKQEALYVM